MKMQIKYIALNKSMTRCSGLKKNLCKEPCLWNVGKGCKKPESVAQAEKKAKIAAKLAKAAAIRAAKDNALATKAAAKASKANKAVKDAKIREVKAVNAVKEAKVIEAKEKMVTPTPPLMKFSWKSEKVKFVFEKDLPLNVSKTEIALYDETPIQKIKDHSKVLISKMLAKTLNIREIYPNLYYVPSKDIFIALIRKRSTKEPDNKKNNDFSGIAFKYATNAKYKISISKKEIVLIENMVGQIKENSNQPLRALKQKYKDTVSVIQF